MSDIGTTSIDSLPLSPQLSENIKMDTTERAQGGSGSNMNMNMNMNMNTNTKIDNPAQLLQQSRDEDPSVAQRNLNQFVTGIQQASAAGMTGLPSRDIPQQQGHLTQDPHMQPSFIPQVQANVNKDYILEHQTRDDIISANTKRQANADSLDDLYSELQIPILIAVLYFLFQLPVVRKNIFLYLPMLFSKDGNPNLSGYIVNSCIFAGLYFGMSKTLKHFSL